MSARLLTFHVTDRCNLNCSHCIRDPGAEPADLSHATFERVLAQAPLYGISHVALTGGEPFLHPDIDKILDSIAAAGLGWHAVSNGSQMDRLEKLLADKRRRAQFKRLVLSLDGATEETHDAIRGPGSHREVMSAALRCTAWGVPFSFQLVVNARNRGELEQLVLDAARLGASNVSVAWLHATGTHLDDALRLPRREWSRVRDEINRLADTVRMPVSMPVGFPQATTFFVCGPWQSEQLHVDVTGQLNLCCQLSGLPGDGARSDRLGDLAKIPLTEAHGNMLELVHDLQRARLEQIREGSLEPWDEMPCNWCCKQFGKPHWTEDGVGGAGAKRERWRGIWANGSNARPLVTRSQDRVRLAVVPDAE